MKKFLGCSLASSAIVLVLGFGIWWICASIEPKPPPGVQCFPKTARIDAQPTDRDEWTIGYNIKQVAVKLKSGDKVAPILRVIRPNFRGFMGSVRTDPIWECQSHFLGEGQAYFDLPLDADIEEYILGLRRIEGVGKPGNDPWHVWMVSQKKVGMSGSGTLIVPRVEGLALLDDNNDAKDLLEKYESAERFASYLRR